MAGSALRIVQLSGPAGRRIAEVEGERLRVLDGPDSVYALANLAIADGVPLADAVRRAAGRERLDYEPIYAGVSPWRILPPIDHPEPARCLVSGTGLTHIRSAANRQAMHAAGVQITDSMRMYESGVQGGRPAPGAIGVSPEWFHKGNGLALRGHNDALEVPAYAEDGGEEPEIAGVYIVDPAGAPRRIGMTVGNEFSDHQFEKRNYLYLASSKLRTCAIGPELAVAPDFQEVLGEVSIERAGSIVWAKRIRTGEDAMCHSLANMEHHHFKFEAHRRPGDVHVHFFGADAFSFGDGVALEDGDWMQVSFDGFGRPLRNRLRVTEGLSSIVRVLPV